MNQEEAFLAGWYDPVSGTNARDWFAIGSMWYTQGMIKGGKNLLGARFGLANDYATEWELAGDIIAPTPGPLTAMELIPFLNSLVDQCGKPNKGFMISHSCWLSSVDLLVDKLTAERCSFFIEYSIAFGPMAEEDKTQLILWGKQQGLEVQFVRYQEADCIPQ